jgi:hypothetical protein
VGAVEAGKEVGAGREIDQGDGVEGASGDDHGGRERGDDAHLVGEGSPWSLVGGATRVSATKSTGLEEMHMTASGWAWSPRRRAGVGGGCSLGAHRRSSD